MSLTETAALDQCLVRYRLWRLWCKCLHCIVRLCEYENTASLLFHFSPRLSHDEKVRYIDICVCIYSCDDVAQGHLIRERELLVTLCSKLGQVLFVPVQSWVRCILVLIAGRVQTFTELLHSVVVRKVHRSRHCPNRSLMYHQFARFWIFR